MGLTLLAFIALPCFLALMVFVLRIAQGQSGQVALTTACVLLAAYSLFQGLIYAFTAPGFSPSLALGLERFSGALLLISYFFILLFALDFPSPPPAILRRLLWIVLIPLAIILGLTQLSSYTYIISVYRPWETIFRIEGKFYHSFVFGEAGIALVAALIMALRAAFSRNRVHRQKAAIAAAAIATAGVIIVLATGVFGGGEGRRPGFAIVPAALVLLVGGLAYSCRLSRLFDWKLIGRVVLGYGALLVVVGLPAGALTALVAPIVGSFFDDENVGIALTAALIFILGATLARLFMRRFFERLVLRSDYRATLEADIAAIDLSAGRDAVLDYLYEHMSKALDSSDFSVLIDDDQGYLRTVFAPTDRKATVERASPLAEKIERLGNAVILKTEAEADPAFVEVRPALLGLFEDLKAEALIIALEGRHMIGIFALGSRSNGGQFTSYDRESFHGIAGKLFVVAYYLKNIARESLLATVDRELALSDQVVRFALEKVDRIDHPKVDASWISLSTRVLGGDFIDFVKLSKDRWFVVVGDVSGKGLSASMNMLILKSMIRTFLRVEGDFLSLVAKVNAFIKDNLPKGTFFAGLFGYLDLSKDVLYYVNCGIPAVLLYSPAFDTFIEVQGKGRILGFAKDVKPLLSIRKLSLGAGATLAMTTDGLVDSENLRGEHFGKERLRRAIQDRLSLSAADIGKGAMQDYEAFTGQRQEDDITLFIMKLRSQA